MQKSLLLSKFSLSFDLTNVLLTGNSIVFVHGLFGKPQDTWTYKSSASPNSPSVSDTEQSRPISQGTHKQKTKIGKLGIRSIFRRSDKGSSVQGGNENGISGRNALQALNALGADPAVGDLSSKSATELFWPAELLPKVVPDSRIYVWGYDVDINHIFSSASQATVFQHSMNLLIDLADCRISDKEVKLHNFANVSLAHQGK